MGQVWNALRGCDLVFYSESIITCIPGPCPTPVPGRAELDWVCRGSASSADPLIAIGVANSVVGQDGVVQSLEWHFDRTAPCTPTAAGVVDRYGTPEKVIWTTAGNFGGLTWEALVLIYPSQGLVFEVHTAGHAGSVRPEDRVLTAYAFPPTTLLELARRRAEYDWQGWPADFQGGMERYPWIDWAEDWPGFSP